MSGILPGGFDAWLTRIPEGPEEPCPVTIREDYVCSTCGCEFSDVDIKIVNYLIEYEDPETKWIVRHKHCDIEGSAA